MRALGDVLFGPGVLWRIEWGIKEHSVNLGKSFLCDSPSPGGGEGVKTGGSCDYADRSSCDYASSPTCDYACDYADPPGGTIRLKARILAGQGAFERDSRGQTYTQWVVNFT